MALKSKFHIPVQQLALALKALVFGGFLGLAVLGDFHIIPVLFFLGSALVLYATPFFNSFAYFASFLALLIFSLSIYAHFSGVSTIFFILFFSLLFYIILGLKNIYFTHRERWHYLLILGNTLLLLLLFFSADKSQFFFLQLSGVFLAEFYLWREFLKLNTNDVQFTAKNSDLITAAIIAFLITEIAWISVVLPLHLLHAVNLTLLFGVLMTDTVIKYLKMRLSRNAMLVNITIFIIFIILIFATG